MNINYFDRKEKQVDLQKKIQSSNMLNAVSKAMMIYNLHIDKIWKTIARSYPQARLKVLKHRDDHVASVMEDAKVKHGIGTYPYRQSDKPTHRQAW